VVVAVSERDSEPTTGLRRPGTLSAFAGVSCFFALVQISTIFVGVIHLAFDRVVALVVLLLSLMLSALFATRFFHARDRRRVAPPPPNRTARLLNAAGVVAGIGAIVWIAWVWLELWILAWLRPPYDWDGLFYHIPAIHEWVVAGRVSWIGHVPDVPYVNFPMGVELTAFVTHSLLGTSHLVDACNLPYWVLAFLSLVVIATRLGARGVWRWVAGALIVGAPVFVSQSVSCYIDPGFSSTVMASVAACAIFVFDRSQSGWWRAVLLGAAVGLCLGSKGTGLPFAVVFVAAATVGTFWVEGMGRWKYVLARMVVVALVLFLVGGYWYTRNAIAAGNPIFPMELKVGEKTIIEGANHVELLRDNAPQWLEKYPGPLRMLVSWLQTDAPISGFDPTGGMGYLWIAGALPAVLFLWLLAVRRRYPGPTREFVFVSALILCLLLVQPARWWARFTVWLHALGLPGIAVAASYAAADWRRSRWHTVTLILVAAMIGVAVWESDRTLDLEWERGRTAEATGLEARFQSSVEYVFPGLADAPGFEEFVDAGKIARGPWGHHGTLLGGILSMPLGEREIFVIREDADATDVESLRTKGVEWLVWDLAGAGDTPEAVAAASSRYYVFHPAHDVNLHFFCLQPDSRSRPGDHE
jgi:hypothetical protein